MSNERTKHDGSVQGRKKRVGAGLSLDKFANAKKSTYDKRLVQERKRQLKVQRIGKYNRLKQRLIRDGKLDAPAVAPQVCLHAVGHAGCQQQCCCYN